MNEFSHLLDLASGRTGAAVVAASDEFFAPKENLLKPEAPVSLPDRYTDRGKWVDGWVTRRRRVPGHDWCVVKLGLAGVVHAIEIDTAFFTGNSPSHCSVEGCGLSSDDDPMGNWVTWHPILERRELSGDAQNTFPVRSTRRYTHLRLNIFPDGGVARFRAMGEVLPDWLRILGSTTDIDLACTVNGGYIVDASDRSFGDPRNILLPHRARDQRSGWLTKRRRDSGHDWTIVRLGLAGTVGRLEIDTAHFKGDAPDSVSVDGAVVEDETDGVSADVSTRAIADWKPVLLRTSLEPDHLHACRSGLNALDATHVRLNVLPDGGISRFRVYGTPLSDARGAALLRLVNSMDVPNLRGALEEFDGKSGWVDRFLEERPFNSVAALRSAAEAAPDLRRLLL